MSGFNNRRLLLGRLMGTLLCSACSSSALIGGLYVYYLSGLYVHKAACVYTFIHVGFQ